MKVFARALSDRRVALVWWSIGILAYCGIIIAFWPVIDGNDEFAELYADMPESFQAMFGADGFTEFTTPPGFLSTYLYSMILPFILTGLAVSMGASLLAGEEEDGLLDLVLSYPVRRRRLVAEKMLSIVVAVGMIGVAVVALLAVAREPVDLDIGVSGLAAATLGSVLFALGYGLLALGAGAWRGVKGFATGTAWGVALGGYLLNVVANLDDSLEGVKYASPLYWATAGEPLQGNLPVEYLVLVGLAGVLAVGTIAVFERHDLS